MVELSRSWIGPPGVQTFDQLTTFGLSWNKQHEKDDPGLEYREFHIRQEWDKSPLPKIQQLVSVPICFQTVIKRIEDVTQC